MRLLLVLGVLSQLLLRGAAVPHEHAAHADLPCHADRPHVHLAGHSHRQSHAHRHRHRDDHEGHDGVAEGSARGATTGEPSPGDDDHVIYLDDCPMLPSGERIGPARTTINRLVSQFAREDVAASVLHPRPRRARPPDDGIATIRTLLPHLLRV